MKKFFRLFAMFLVFSLLLSSNSFVSASSNNNPNVEQDALIEQIDLLFKERSQIIFSNQPDLERLDEIDMTLHNLGVEFHTEEEAAELFPDAVASANLIPNSSCIDSENIAMPAFNVDGWTSSKNLWTSYRISDYYCEDEWLNIQRVQVQPLSEESSLWQEGATYVDFSDSPTYIASTNILNLSVSTALGLIHPVLPTMYDLLTGTLDYVQSTSAVTLNDIDYRWECATTVVFSYVRYENQSDYTQLLTLVTSSCELSVAYIIDIHEVRNVGNGITAPVPSIVPGHFSRVCQSQNHTSVGRAAFVFLRADSLAPSLEGIVQIEATAPGAVEKFYIRPSNPSLPLHIT